MSDFYNAVMTDSGAALLAATTAGVAKIKFTKLVIGSGVYTEQEKSRENLQTCTRLKAPKQEIPFSSISMISETCVKLAALVSNATLEEGYYINETGIYAVDEMNEEAEPVLYSIAVANVADYFPPYNGLTPSTITQEYFTMVDNSLQATIQIESGIVALAEDLIAEKNRAEEKETQLQQSIDEIKSNAQKVGVCTTLQGVPAKIVDCPDFVLRNGARVLVTFSNGSSTDSMTINVNGTGAYQAWFPLGQTCADNDKAISKLIAAGCAYEFIFQKDNANSKWVYCGVVSTAESLGALSKKDLSNHLGGPGIPIIQSATDSGGLMEIGKYIDFHDAGSQADFDVRLYCDHGKLVSTVPIQAPGGTVSGSITGSGGGAFAIDGNVYIKSQGYDGWLTNYLGQYFPKTGGTLSGDLVFQGRGKKLHFGDDNSSCPYMMCNDGSDSDLEIYAPSGYVSVNDNLSARKNSYFSGDVHFENQQKNISLKLGPNVAIDFAGTGFETSSASIGGGYPLFYGHGCIFGDNIDTGYMNYVARGHYYSHGFYSINENGKNLGAVTLSGGNVSCNTVNGKSADYAENWEWEDGNPNGEDRVGLFVTFNGSKIILSTNGDCLAKVGVVSGSPCIIGDSDDGREWKHKYLKDVYGRLMKDEQGGLIINPEYDPEQTYISRSNRPEWDAVGTHGKLVVRDDGTCQPDGFCVPTDGGIATAAEEGFYVMERLDESHIRIYMR